MAEPNEPYSPLAVANYFLDLAKSKGAGLDPMKLQKMIYFAHGWHLALYREPLINEEVQAWEYGPVVQSVYHEFKSFGADKIEKLATDFDYSTRELCTPRIPLSDQRTIALLNKIWDIYGGYSGIQLSHLTHAPNSAWSNARIDNKKNLKFVGIENDAIEEEFKAKIAK